MFSSTISLGLAILPLVSCAVYDITVGTQDGQLLFEPEAIGAAIGDQVIFHFWPKNHSVVQTSFASPCGPKEGGINTGFKPVAANSTDEKPTHTITVDNTDPMWFMCSQARDLPASHCGAGMVFSINCGPDGAENSFTNFKKSALAIGEQLKASGSDPYGGGSAGGSAGSNTWTAAYGDATVPPVANAEVVTQTITLDSSSVWTTVYTSYPGSPAPTPAAAEGVVHKVTVGGTANGLKFNPPQVAAAPRDIIEFSFLSKNHSVVQSSFTDPCRPLSANGTTGFKSGFQAVSDDSNPTTWRMTVNDTAPIWAYCSQQTGNHCGSGMVFAVNSVESSERNFSAFQALAERVNGTAAGATAGGNGGTGSGATGSEGSASGLKVATVGVLAGVAAVAALL